MLMLSVTEVVLKKVGASPVVEKQGSSFHEVCSCTEFSLNLKGILMEAMEASSIRGFPVPTSPLEQ